MTARRRASRANSITPSARALARIAESGPILATHGFVRWRRKDLAFWIFEEFRITLDETTVGRELRALGIRKISARPRHRGQNEFAGEDSKNFHGELEDIRARLPANINVKLWWQDEARVGQKTKLTRRWAPRGSRPMAPKDQRTKSAYIFGAICPQRDVGAGLVLPRRNTQAM